NNCSGFVPLSALFVEGLTKSKSNNPSLDFTWPSLPFLAVAVDVKITLLNGNTLSSMICKTFHKRDYVKNILSSKYEYRTQTYFNMLRHVINVDFYVFVHF